MNVAQQNKKKQLEIDFAVWLENFNFLEDILKQKKHFKLKSFIGKYNSPLECAKELRKKLGIKDSEPINSIIDLVESIGVKINVFTSDIPGVFGLSLNDSDGGPAIGVNVSENISVERQIFTVAHELGHIFLHPDSYKIQNEPDYDMHEKQADIFASYFLMPNDAFKNQFDKNKGLHWVDLVLHVKRFFKVSYATVLKRLVDNKIVDSKINVWLKFTTDIKSRYNVSLKNHHEQNSIIDEIAYPIVKADFMENRISLLVREAYEKELITLDKSAAILGINLHDMRELANSWRFFA